MSRIETAINKTVIIFLSFLIFFSGMGLIVAGVRTRKKLWTICGLSYICLGWIFMSMGLVTLYMLLYLASIVHTIIVCKEYCMRLKVLKESKDIILQKKKEQAEKQEAEIYKAIIGEKRSEKEEIVRDMRIRQADINIASETELSHIPGIGLIVAKRIIDVRKEKPFLSLEDFYKRLSIAKDKEKVMAKYLTCTESYQREEMVKIKEESKDLGNHVSGRRIDI